MKKYIALFLTLLLVLGMTACAQRSTAGGDGMGDDSQFSLSESITNLESENAALQSEIDRLIRENDNLQNRLAAYEKAEQAEQEAITVQEGDVTVLMTGKSERYDKYEQPNIDFVFVITNNTDKEIKGIQGTCTFNDLFGKEIMRMNCDFVGETIAPGGSITVTDMYMDCNQFMDDHMKLFNTALDDLNFEYTVKMIVFTDGTSKTVE